MLKPTIGLEIHIEAKTNSKMFCSCKNDPEEKEPNKNICPVCLGHPGALPTINRSAIEKIILAGLALNCKIKNYSRFDRKSYFYPDLPKGYQISQFDFPICKDGYLDVHLDDGTIKRIRINRIHMEEDTARLIHEGSSTLVDFNRSSVPLMELVTEPDINSAEEAKKFAQELQLILKYNDISGANMEKGQMRCEVNISLSDTEKLGTKVEIKNLNSFKAVEKSIEYEIKRQKEIIEKGGKVKQETRGWYDDKQITMDQREKEDAFEYRYFPDPDLPPLNISDEEIEKIKKRLVELPEQKRKRFKEEYNLDDKSIEFYINEPSLADYFEKVISELDCWKKHKNCEKDSIKVCSNYIITDLQAIIKNDPDFISIDERITPENFAELISMLENNEISSNIAKIILLEMYKTKGDPSNILKEKELSQITNDSEIESIVKSVIEENTKAVSDYKAGKTNSFMFLVGQVMAKSKGKITPQKAEEIIKKLI